jgi:hypothetical protein
MVTEEDHTCKGRQLPRWQRAHRTYFAAPASQTPVRPGGGVICGKRALPGVVIPAKAGIHFASHWKCADDGLDSRLRGNDGCFERDSIPNDATTVPPAMIAYFR